MHCCLLIYAYRETASSANNRSQHIKHRAFDLLACASCTLYIDNEIRWAVDRGKKWGGREKQKREMQRAFISLCMVRFVLCSLSVACALFDFHHGFASLPLLLSSILFSARLENRELRATKKSHVSWHYFWVTCKSFFATKRSLIERSDLLS